jgi:hypothetical protein
MKMNELVESLADDFMKMAREKGMNVRVAGTPEQEKQRTMDMLAKRRAEQEHRNREVTGQDHANLHQLEAEYEKMKNEYKSLGGSSWQYADREQNLTASERKARSMEDDLNRLHARIVRARKHGEQGMSESASAGATSAANIGTVDAPQLSPGKARGKKSYTGSPGKSGTKAPPQPKVVQPKTSAGTAVNALDMKGKNIFGQAAESAVIKRR